MKVQFLIETEEDNEWRDLYIDENTISGFYMHDEEDNVDACINVMFNFGVYTFKQTNELLKFLETKFILC